MFNFFKIMVILGLLAAVAVSGFKLYRASSKINAHVITNSAKLQKIIEKAKKIATTTKENTTIGKTEGVKKKNISGPIDTEDAKLTSEVLTSLHHEVKPKFEKTSHNQKDIKTKRIKKSFDFKRTSKIEAIYISTAKILNLE